MVMTGRLSKLTDINTLKRPSDLSVFQVGPLIASSALGNGKKAEVTSPRTSLALKKLHSTSTAKVKNASKQSEEESTIFLQH